mgnify:CR=1 FL=1
MNATRKHAAKTMLAYEIRTRQRQDPLFEEGLDDHVRPLRHAVTDIQIGLTKREVAVCRR